MVKVGDLMVYPAHGVGRIMAFENLEIMGMTADFCVIQILDNEMTIRVPMSNMETVGIRNIIDETQVDQVFKILKQKKRRANKQTWNRRQRDYTEKIKTGSAFEIAEVLRDLYSLKNKKELSFGERKMLDTAQSLLVKELSIAKSANEAEIEKMIAVIFH
jgi:CarD family transcriptional regulator, regulator of rRNA transcription